MKHSKTKSKPKAAKTKKRKAQRPRTIELAVSNPGWIRAKAVRVVRDKLGRAVRLAIQGQG